MKTKLLSLLFTTVLFTSAINAQTKIWDLGGNVAPWAATANPGLAGGSGAVVVDNLGLVPAGTSTSTVFGAINGSAKTFATTPAYTSVNRFQMNGGGSASTGTFLPSQRYLYFTAAGSVSVEVCFIGGGSGNRTMYVTDGTNVLGSLTTPDSATNQVLTTTAAVVNGTVYIYGDQACNLYRVKVTGPLGTTTVLGTDDFQSQSTLKVVAANRQVNISNVISSTEVNVYNMTGALVKTLKIDADTTFDIPNSGLYVVNVKSAEGEKSVKVAIK